MSCGKSHQYRVTGLCIEDVLVRVGELIFPVDFYVLNMEEGVFLFVTLEGPLFEFIGFF